jgi:uncharacterized membrane protein
MIKPNSSFHLILLSALSVLLLRARMSLTGELAFLFMGWNLFLAWVAYGIGKIMVHEKIGQFSSSIRWGNFFLWLAFFPNTIHLLTDLVHLDQESLAPVWFDAFLLTSFALNGLLLSLASFRDAHTFLAKRFRPTCTNFLLVVLALLSGVGLYLGRFLRFNSWDALLKPSAVLDSTLKLLSNRADLLELLVYAGCFGSLLLISYGFVHSVPAAKRGLEQGQP